MKRGIVLVCLFFLFGFGVYAVPAAPSPSCEIDAYVEKVIGSEKLKVSINNVSTKKDVGEKSCKELYKPDSEQILKAGHGVSIADIEAGDSIHGVINFSGDEFRHGTYLNDYNITNKKEEDNDNDKDKNISDITGNESSKSTNENDYDIINYKDEDKDGDKDISDTTKNELSKSTNSGKSFLGRVWSWIVNMF